MSTVDSSEDDYANTLEAIGRAWRGVPLWRTARTKRSPTKWPLTVALLTLDDINGYRSHERAPVTGTYRGYDIVSMAPPSSGGTHIVQMLNILEGYDVGEMGFGSPRSCPSACRGDEDRICGSLRAHGRPVFDRCTG